MLNVKKELSVSDVNAALAKAFSNYATENFDDPSEILMFGVILGSDIARRTIKELFKSENEGNEE